MRYSRISSTVSAAERVDTMRRTSRKTSAANRLNSTTTIQRLTMIEVSNRRKAWASM